MPKFRVAPITTLAAIILLGVLAGSASAAVDDTLFISRAGGFAGAGGNQNSYSPSISDDGCRLAFSSDADNLVMGDVNGSLDIFVRDLCVNPPTTELVSRADGALGAIGDGSATVPAISGDGKMVAFNSTASNIDDLGYDTDSTVDVYRRELDPPYDTKLVSINAAGNDNVLGDQTGSGPGISEDGAYVAWTTDTSAVTVVGATVTDPVAATKDVFRRDMAMNANQLVSTATGSTVAGNGQSIYPSLSNNGDVVAFQSGSSDLIGPGVDVNGVNDAFVRKVGAAETTLESRASGPAGALGNASSDLPNISADGATVAFQTQAENFGPSGPDYDVYARDLDGAQPTELLSRRSGAAGPLQNGMALYTSTPSEDGRFVAFSSTDPQLAEGPVTTFNVFVRDRLNQTTFMISRASGALGAGDDGGALSSELAANGRSVAFSSSGTNLSTDDNDSFEDIFHREIFEPTEPVPTASANLRPLQGTVLVNGAPLLHSTQVSVGSIVDATNGRVELTADNNGVKESMKFYSGLFEIQQSAADGIMTAALAGPLDNCIVAPVLNTAAPNKSKKKKKKKKRKKKRAALATASRPSARAGSRSLWGSGTGSFRTRGARGSATVRGTEWLTTDRCDGTTLFEVSSGTIAVDDFGLPNAVDALVSGGGSYAAVTAAAPQPQVQPVAKKKKRKKKGKNKKRK